MTTETKSRWTIAIGTTIIAVTTTVGANAIVMGQYKEKIDVLERRETIVEEKVEKLRDQNAEQDIIATRMEAKLDQILQTQERIEQENIGLMKAMGARGFTNKQQ